MSETKSNEEVRFNHREVTTRQRALALALSAVKVGATDLKVAVVANEGDEYTHYPNGYRQRGLHSPATANVPKGYVYIEQIGRLPDGVTHTDFSRAVLMHHEQLEQLVDQAEKSNN